MRSARNGSMSSIVVMSKVLKVNKGVKSFVVKRKLKAETYFVNGRHYTQAQAAAAFVPVAKKIAEDYDAMGEVVNYETEGGGSAFDKQSIDEYFTSIGATGWMREMLESAYVTEYGLELGEQSALNFLFLIGTGALFIYLGEFSDWYEAVYHSAVNFTSLGYGDVVMSDRWKLMGPLEAANGVLMFGMTSAALMAILQQMIKARVG